MKSVFAATDEPRYLGAYNRENVLDLLALAATEAANAVGVTRAALSTFFNDRIALSDGMALRTEKTFGLPVEPLVRMRCDFDIAQSQARTYLIQVARYVQRQSPSRHELSGW